MIEKMLARGKPLKEWDVKINYGIKTGYNAAFVIDDHVRQELIGNDPKCGEHIRPLLQGRDIERYHSPLVGKWLINTHNGFGDEKPVEVESIPALRAHLDKF